MSEKPILRNINDRSQATKALIEVAERIGRKEEVDFIFAVRFKVPQSEGGGYQIQSTWHSSGKSTIAVYGLVQWLAHTIVHYIDENL